jgi:hypothetical protein
VQGGSFFETSHAALTSPARFCITATTLSPWASGEGAPPPSASDLSLKSGCRCALDMLKIARTSAGEREEGARVCGKLGLRECGPCSAISLVFRP